MSERRNLKAKTRHKTLRTCKNGHQYYKSSDCFTCPVCEAQRKSNDGFLSLLSAPARRALEAKSVYFMPVVSFSFFENVYLPEKKKCFKGMTVYHLLIAPLK